MPGDSERSRGTHSALTEIEKKSGAGGDLQMSPRKDRLRNLSRSNHANTHPNAPVQPRNVQAISGAICSTLGWIATLQTNGNVSTCYRSVLPPKDHGRTERAGGTICGYTESENALVRRVVNRGTLRHSGASRNPGSWPLDAGLRPAWREIRG